MRGLASFLPPAIQSLNQLGAVFISEETMSKLKPSTLALLLPLFLSPILAENADLVGCNEVSCPQDGADDRCTVEDDTFLGVGVSHIPDVPSTLEGFSLVKGVNVSAGMAGKDNDKPTRPFTSVYYLGVPEEADTEDLSGCAVIFNNPPEKKFKGPELEGSENGTDTRAATGTCSDVIEQRCIDTIAQRARNITDDSNGNTCDALERGLKENSFDGCSGFGGQGNSLGNFTVRPLEDLNTVRNSSDCWPIQQKSDRLMKIADVTSHVSAILFIHVLYILYALLTS